MPNYRCQIHNSIKESLVNLSCNILSPGSEIHVSLLGFNDSQIAF